MRTWPDWLEYIVGERSLYWETIPPAEESAPSDRRSCDFENASEARSTSNDELSNVDVLAILLFLILGLFSGAFSVALLFRRIAIALAVTGPMLFSIVWVGWEWKKFGSKQFAFGAFAVGFTLTFLALDREP